MEKLVEEIFYLKHTDNPLSSDVYLIKDDNKIFLFDVGSNPDFVEELNGIDATKIVIISHFHNDHTKNLNKISCSKIYVNKETSKYFDGVVIKDVTKLSSNIQVGLLSSSHTKDSTYLLFKGYLLVGDAMYSSNKGYNVQKLKNLIKEISSIDFKNIIQTHLDVIKTKDEILNELNAIYNSRSLESNYITNV